MIRSMIVAAMLMFSSVTLADEVTLTLASKHLTQSGYNKTHQYNEFNPGIGYYFERWNLETGIYKNSYSGRALYAGRRYETKYVGITYGLTHYTNFKWQDGNNNISPFILFTKDIKNFRVGYSPMIRKNSRDKWIYGLFTLQYFIPVN